ncbi:MAG: FkbM family methyltransferase [Pseudomonadota bacterium]
MITDFVFMLLGIDEIAYLDIGAHHPTWLSNTYHFYGKGDHGVLIEPDEDLCKGLRKKRPKDRVLNLAVGVSGDDKISMYVMTSRTLNTLDKAQAEALQASGRERIEEVRNVRRLGINEILAEHFGGSKPNFVSLDIEGLDFDILQAWDFDRFRPEIFCVETLTYSQSNTERKLTEIIDLMISRRYRIYADTYVNTIFVCEDAWLKRPIYT